jgi:hypothetical protein
MDKHRDATRFRRAVVAKEVFMTEAMTEPTVHMGRFSEGMEQQAKSPDKLRHGRFSSGIDRLPEVPGKLHVGRFSEGIEQLPDTVKKRRKGSFADGLREAMQDEQRSMRARRLRPAA